MPRNGHTRKQHDARRAQIERSEKDLAKLEQELQKQNPAPIEDPAINPAKERRRARLKQNRRYKKFRSTGEDTGR